MARIRWLASFASLQIVVDMCSFDVASLRSLPFDLVDCRASASFRLLLPLMQPTSTGIPLRFPSLAVRTRFSTQKYNLEPAFDASFLIFIDLMRWGFQARLCSSHPSTMLHLLRKTTALLANVPPEVPRPHQQPLPSAGQQHQKAPKAPKAAERKRQQEATAKEENREEVPVVKGREIVRSLRHDSEL